MSATRLTVCVGGGGVGKTTTSAALGLHLARGGARTLVITVDPARRLADALGIEIGQQTCPVPLPGAEGRLAAKMPDPRTSMTEFTAWLWQDPAQRTRVMQNPAYAELSNSLAGVHDLLTVGLLQNEIDAGKYDEVVLDTAPSRNALAFLSYPARLLDLLEARALAWLSSLAAATPDTDNGPPSSRPGGLFAWGRSKVEGLFGRVVGIQALRNLSALFSDMASVRGRWAELARRTDTLLKHPSTRYFLVGAPTGGALADITYLLGALERRSLKPAAVILNRAERGVSTAEREVADLLERGPSLVSPADVASLRAALAHLAGEHGARAAAADAAVRFLIAKAPRGTPILRLPFLGPAPPREIVVGLADVWASTFR